MIRDGENGYLLPVGDVDGMAEAALTLLRDEDRRRAFGVAGRRWAETQFSREDVVARYRAIYQRVVAAVPRCDTRARLRASARGRLCCRRYAPIRLAGAPTPFRRRTR